MEYYSHTYKHVSDGPLQIRRKSEAVLTLKSQTVLLFAGLRGAIAFALSIRDTSTEARRVRRRHLMHAHVVVM